MDRRLKASELSTWMLSHGVTSMRTDKIASLLSIPPEQVRTRLAAQRKARATASPARGLWVPVPPERVARECAGAGRLHQRHDGFPWMQLLRGLAKCCFPIRRRTPSTPGIPSSLIETYFRQGDRPVETVLPDKRPH